MLHYVLLNQQEVLDDCLTIMNSFNTFLLLLYTGYYSNTHKMKPFNNQNVMASFSSYRTSSDVYLIMFCMFPLEEALSISGTLF